MLRIREYNTLHYKSIITVLTHDAFNTYTTKGSALDVLYSLFVPLILCVENFSFAVIVLIQLGSCPSLVAPALCPSHH